MSTITEIREALRQEVAGTLGVEFHRYTPGQVVTPPAAFIGGIKGFTAITQDGARSVTLPLWLVVPRGDGEQEQLDEFLDATIECLYDASFEETVAATLGPVAFDSHGLVQVGGADYWGLRLDLTFTY